MDTNVKFLRRLKAKAFAEGVEVATKEAIPRLEARYALRMVGRFWFWLILASMIAFAAGGAVGVGWARSGLDGSPQWERAK